MKAANDGFDRFESPRGVIDYAVRRLKEHGNVAPDATYNNDARGGLRREIAYHDEDFLWYLGHPGRELEVAIVNAAVEDLTGRGIVSPNAVVDHVRFDSYRERVRPSFSGSWTSFTPVMERLFYAFTELKRPARLVEYGCFWGNTLAWFGGPAIGTDKVYQAESIIGVDTDAGMMEKARANFMRINAGDDVQLVTGDARKLARDTTDPIDFLYLEAKMEGEPSIYLELLQSVYDQLPKGGWVIAHDIYDKDTIGEFDEYLAWVRDPANFRASIAFDVDFCGAELSVK